LLRSNTAFDENGILILIVAKEEKNIVELSASPSIDLISIESLG